MNNSIALFVVVVVMFLFIPLNPMILDILLVVNIGLSIMILMITMNIAEALDFSIFPSLLLITTLFRLGMNVYVFQAGISKGSGLHRGRNAVQIHL